MLQRDLYRDDQSLVMENIQSKHNVTNDTPSSQPPPTWQDIRFITDNKVSFSK